MDLDEMSWDLSALVKDPDPIAIQTDLNQMVKEAGELRASYYGKIKELDANGLAELFQKDDRFTLKFEGTREYCSLLYAADSTNEIGKQLHATSEKAITDMNKALAFIPIEVAQLVIKNPALINDPVLKEDWHYLEKLYQDAKHLLSEPEEQLIMAKDRNGIIAWETFHEEWLTTRKFTIEIDEHIQELPYGKIISFYQDSRREIRKRAYQTVYESLGKDPLVWGSSLRSICEDHLEMIKVRHYNFPIEPSLVVNDVDMGTIKELIDAVRNNADIYRQYLKLKTKIMGLERLANYDVMAPIPTAPNQSYSWETARLLITKIYSEFDEEMGGWVRDMYQRKHLDGAVRNGKRSGGFCSFCYGGKTAFILQSYNNRLGDIFTQIHEMGHAIHNYASTRTQNSLVNMDTGMCLCEVASTFGELLLMDHLLTESVSPAERQAILASFLDEIGICVFQVTARFLFENALYAAIQHGEFLDGERITELWLNARAEIYGDVVDWLDVMKWEWVSKVHYYMANFRFYNYPYVFAQLFALALFRLYKEQGSAFVPKFKRFLAAGGSKSPRELAAEIGLDISHATFWEKGLAQVKKFVEQFRNSMGDILY